MKGYLPLVDVTLPLGEVKRKCIIIIYDIIYVMACTTTQVHHHTVGIYVQKSISQCSGCSNVRSLIRSSLSPIVAR